MLKSVFDNLKNSRRTSFSHLKSIIQVAATITTNVFKKHTLAISIQPCNLNSDLNLFFFFFTTFPASYKVSHIASQRASIKDIYVHTQQRPKILLATKAIQLHTRMHSSRESSSFSDRQKSCHILKTSQSVSQSSTYGYSQVQGVYARTH